MHYLLGKLYRVLGRKADMHRAFALAQDLEPRMARCVRLGLGRPPAWAVADALFSRIAV